MAWLICDGQVLASAEVARTRAQRRRGLLGRTDLDGVFVLSARSVHTIGMRFAIDVAFCDGDGRVVRLITMAPNRICRPVRSARTVIEAPSGAMRRWQVTLGDCLEVVDG